MIITLAMVKIPTKKIVLSSQLAPSEVSYGCEDRLTCSVRYFSTVIFITLPDNFNKWYEIFASLHLALAFTTLNFHFCSSLHNVAFTDDSVLSRTLPTALHAHVCHVCELELCKELFFLFAGGLR